jgi:TPR repeat protein
MPGYSSEGKQAASAANKQLKQSSMSKTGLYRLFYPNKTAAIAALHTLSDLNFARAQFELGLAYSVGNGVPQDHAMAVAQLEKAAIQSDPGAHFILARYFETGLGGIPANLERAKSLKLAVALSGIDFTSLVLHSR